MIAREYVYDNERICTTYLEVYKSMRVCQECKYTKVHQECIIAKVAEHVGVCARTDVQYSDIVS